MHGCTNLNAEEAKVRASMPPIKGGRRSQVSNSPSASKESKATMQAETVGKQH